MRVDAYKKGILYIFVALLICCAGYWLGIRDNIHDDGAGIDGAIDDLRATGQQAEAAAGSLGEAGEAVEDAAGTAEDIERGNQQLTEISGSIEGLIDQGQQILAGIRSRGEKKE